MLKYEVICCNWYKSPDKFTCQNLKMAMNQTILFLLLFVFSTLRAELFFTPQMIRSHLEKYTQEEIDLIEKDLSVVRSVCLDATRNTENLFYLATAGAPGARKTTILEKFKSVHPEYRGGVYLDPDPRTLKYMVHTYYERSLSPLVISNSENYDQVIKNAYEKWRSASNYIVLTLLEEAFSLGRSIIYGTTSTGAHTPSFLAKLKENGYKITLLLCSCPDEVRKKAIDYRNDVTRFYQSSADDTTTKGKFFPERMKDYFAYADLIYFYWSDDLFSPERLGATWSKGRLEIEDGDAMQRFIDKYEADRLSLDWEGKTIPPLRSFFSDLK